MIPFIQAKNYTKVSGVRTIDVIVTHDMEAPEAQATAENVARWGAGPTAPEASWHFAIDSDSIVQSVLVNDVAWHAPGANHNGIGLEHAGYARQSREQWHDAYSWEMLQRSAELVAQLCEQYNIPVRFVNATALKRGQRGITTHAEVSKAFKRSNHTDPGPSFPMTGYIALVRAALDAPPPTAEKKWPIPVPKWFWAWATWRLNGKVGKRPTGTPLVIPPWAWRRLKALQAARKD